MTEEDKDEQKANFICGVVEGFYGRPWSSDQRYELFRRISYMGMNTYVYAPKDDLKHRANWRDLYTPEEADHLQSLIQVADSQNVVFVYALSPGIDIVYSSQKDVTAIKQKLEQVQRLGCNAFAILFDDIDPTFAEADRSKFTSFAHAQVSVANEVYEHMNLLQFFFCPTEYCESRAVPSLEQSEYLDVIGRKLLPGIHVMWTGPRVISRWITPDHARRVGAVLRRPPLIWDNLHANDYDNRRVFLGPYSGRPIALKPLIAGVLTNPNCEFEANFSAFSTLAHWIRCEGEAEIEDETDATLEAGGVEPVAEEVTDKAKPIELYHPLKSLSESLKAWLAIFALSRKGFGSSVLPRPNDLPVPTGSNVDPSIADNMSNVSSCPITSYGPEPLADTQQQPLSAPEGTLPIYTPQEVIQNLNDPLAPPPLIAVQCDPALLPDHSLSTSGFELPILAQQPVNSFASDFTVYCEPMEVGAPSVRRVSCAFGLDTLDDQMDQSIDTSCDKMQIDRDDTFGLNRDKLQLLTDLFYLPFEHGPKGKYLISEFKWLKANARVVNQAKLSGNEVQSAEWLRRLQVYCSTCEKVTELYFRLLCVPNRNLASDFYPYLWEIQVVVSLLCTFVKWLSYGYLESRLDLPAEAAVEPLTDSLVPINDLADSTTNIYEIDEEPWVWRGGLITDLQKVLLEDSMTRDLFLIRPINAPVLRTFRIRPATLDDKACIYELARCTFDDGSDASDRFAQFPDLIGDRCAGTFLEMSPEYCFVAELDTLGMREIIGYAVGAKDVTIFLDKCTENYVSVMCEKYPQSLRASPDKPDSDISDETNWLNPEDLIAGFHNWAPKVPQSFRCRFGSLIQIKLRGCFVDTTARTKLAISLIATLKANGSTGVYCEVRNCDKKTLEMYEGKTEMNHPEARWCPTRHDHFITLSPNYLGLYKTEADSDGNQSFSLLARNPGVQFMKCFDLHPRVDFVVAAGFANGRVALTSPSSDLEEKNDVLGKSPFEKDMMVGREFFPKHQRSCQSVLWNRVMDQWLAACFDKEKYKGDNGVFIWDVYSRPSSAAETSTSNSGSLSLSRNRSSSHMTSSDTIRPLYECAMGESGSSIAWSGSHTLICGLSHKYLRIYDFRDNARCKVSISTKAVEGLAMDPFNDHRVGSFVDNTLYLWDVRLFDKPLLTIAEARPILKFAWEPKRRDALSLLCKDSPVIKQFTLLSKSLFDEELTYSDRHVFPTFDSTDELLSSFCWHPEQESRLLAVSQKGRMTDMKISEYSCVAWSYDNSLLTSFGTVMTEHDTLNTSVDDLSQRMFLRASNEYGLKSLAETMEQLMIESKTEITHIDLKPKLDSVTWVWSWMDRIRSMASMPTNSAWQYDIQFPSVQTILKQPLTETGTRMEYRQVETHKSDQMDAPLTKIYHSKERERVLRVCGWLGLDEYIEYIDEALSDCKIFLLRSDKPHYDICARAAAIALFRLNPKVAIEFLLQASSSESQIASQFRLVAMALAGCQTQAADRSEQALIWQRLCCSMGTTIDNPFLRAIFTFLTCRLEPDSQFGDILDMNDLPLVDRVAFACLYLADHPLRDLLDCWTRQCIMEGDLDGLLLTGLGRTEQCVRLLQNYVDNTSDIQTAALLLIHSGCRASTNASPLSETPRSPLPASSSQGSTISVSRVSEDSASTVVPYGTNLIDAYFSLLNQWRLWHIRAQLENMITVNTIDKSNIHSKAPPQVFLACNFCTRAVYFRGDRSTEKRPMQMKRLNCCPHCNKPLPRCALCRRHIGTPLPTGSTLTATSASDKPITGSDNKQHKFSIDSWFSWCHSCRHGGHVIHMNQWFSNYAECPVTGCNCRCSYLDTTLKNTSE